MNVNIHMTLITLIGPIFQMKAHSLMSSSHLPAFMPNALPETHQTEPTTVQSDIVIPREKKERKERKKEKNPENGYV